MNNYQPVKHKNILLDLFNITNIAIYSVLFVYTVILIYIQNGISCDEGYYLMGYLTNQELGAMVSDFHNIIRYFSPDNMQENVLFFRYFRFVLDFISALLFGIISYQWLKQKKDFNLSRILYLSLILLSASVSYTYTSPTISFDHLQHILYLFTFSFFFAAEILKNKLMRFFSMLFCGYFLVLSIFNYLPSGLLLLFVLLVFTILQNSKTSVLSKIFIIAISLLINLSLYHISITPFHILFENIMTSIKVASDGATKHDNSSLILEMLSAIGLFLSIQTPLFLIGYIYKRIEIHHKILIIFSVAIILVLMLFREIYVIHGYLYYMPISFLWGLYFAKNGFFYKKTQVSEIIFFFIASLLPFIGVFGTNQPVVFKIVIFIPFWSCLFLLLLAKLNLKKSEKNCLILITIVLYSMGYLYQGSFRQYHSYYTPRSSKYEFTLGERFKGVKVSSYEAKYYKTLVETLKSIGFKSGMTALAFGEQQIGLYLIGGYFHGPLVYSSGQYVKIPNQRASYIILFRKEEQSVVDQLVGSGWNFPADYNKIEIGTMAENLDSENYTTIIYHLK